MIAVPPPDLQVLFAARLMEIRGLCLQCTLLETVKRADIAKLDAELRQIAPAEHLAALAGHGLRGELMFATPYLIELNPRLLGYYRLMLGFSQKGFYSSASGMSRFKSMEESGRLSKLAAESLAELCYALGQASSQLLLGIGAPHLSAPLLHDLTLLTLGAQLRGSALNKIGSVGIAAVFEVMHQIVKSHAVEATASEVVLINSAGRRVTIAVAADPDIVIRDTLSNGEQRNIVAIEVKAGTDASNIHNRLGEAEKSHLKARKAGYIECWTIVNVTGLEAERARHESPSTDRFYNISEITSEASQQFADFRDRLAAMTGIPDIQRK